MKSKTKYYWLLLGLPLFFVVWFAISKKENKPVRYLAYFGPKNALKINDTTYHQVPEFEFTSQFNTRVNSNSVAGKIYVTEYFFTTCKSICPIMNNNLEKVYKKFRAREDFLILSHTVDPETDSVSVLKAYADRRGVVDQKWLFVTGEKKKLYELARKGYLLNAEEGNGDSEDFIHTQNFALIDKERHIRGFYDGTDSLEIERLMQEITILQNEYAYKEKHAD